MEKKCLIIAYHFYPNGGVGAKRFNLLTSYFSNKFKVLDILTIKEKYFEEKDESLIYGGKIHRTYLFPRYPYKGNELVRKMNKVLTKMLPIDHSSAWILPTFFRGMKIMKSDKINTIIVTGPPFAPFITGYLLSSFFNAELILDYQDPWVLDKDRPEESNFTKKYNWYLEKTILKRATKIIFNTLEAKDNYSKLNVRFNINEKSFVIPNPYLQKEKVVPLNLEKDKKVIIYAGNFYGKRRLKYIFEPLKKLFGNGKLDEKISIHVFGRIHTEDAELIKKYNLSQIIFEHERIEYSLLKRYLKGADVLYLSQGEDHCFSVPYKLTDYLTIGKPILAVTDKGSSTYNFMKDLDCGVVADIDDPESIYNALKNLLINEKKFSFSKSEKYSLQNIAENYYNIIIN